MQRKYIISLVVAIVLVPVIWFAVKVFYRAWELENKYSDLVEQQADEVVLINIGDGDRAYLARLLDTVDYFQPKVIVLNALLSKYSNSSQDSLLLNSIKSSNTFLRTKHQGMSHYGTHKAFLDASIGYSFFEPYLDDGEVHDFYLYRISNEEREFNLAYMAAYNYSSEKAQSYLEAGPSQPQLMVISRMPEYLKAYEYQDFSFSKGDLEGKIVLLGYLGPGNEDRFVTKVGILSDKSDIYEPDTYGTQLLANQILMILERRY